MTGPRRGARPSAALDGPSSAFFETTLGASANVGATVAAQTTLASLKLPAGTYVVVGSTAVWDFVAPEVAHCNLNDSRVGDFGVSDVTTTTSSYMSSASLVGAFPTPGSTISLRCWSTDGHTHAQDSDLAAIKVGSLSP